MPVDPRAAAANAQEWDDYTSDLNDALQGSAGFEREKISAQLKDAQAGRDNAYKIAQLSASTQRYGIDKNFEAEMKRLLENQRQFDLNHALEKEKFAEVKRQFGLEYGLKYADTAAGYLSTPDRFAQGMDFRQMADRALTGAYGGGESPQGPQPYGTGVDFQPKTPEDFAALAGFGQPGNNAGAGWSPTRTGVTEPFRPSPKPQPGPWQPPGPGEVGIPRPPTAPAGGLTGAPDGGDAGVTPRGVQFGPGDNERNAGGGPFQAPDPRVKVMKTMMDAMPPSEGSGLDPNDFAVMKAAQALYSTNLRPGALQGMRPDQRAIFGSFVRRSGRSLNDFMADYDAYQPHQRNVRSA